MKEVLNFISTNPDAFNTMVSLIFAVCVQFFGLVTLMWKLGKGKITAEQALLILTNTLKDEKKMSEDGKVFKPETMQKVDEVAQIINATLEAKEKVKDTLKQANRQDGIKIGSHHGKPIFLEDISRVGGILRPLGKLFRR